MTVIASRKERGQLGEELVANLLKKKGFEILAKNYRKKFGEIDLIAENKDLLLFVEVKLRSSNSIDLAELIGVSKRRRIGAAARAYIAETGCTQKTGRFDVALVDVSQGNPEITYIADAFNIDEGF